MIERAEIEQKAAECGIHQSHVQRDYVFGWFLVTLYSDSALKDLLVLKGGNCFRKAYFPNTRFSADLDFSTERAVDELFVQAELNKICTIIQAKTAVRFDTDRTKVALQNELDKDRRVFDARIYFNDFYGNSDHIWLRVSIDITEFDRLYLPIQQRPLIHPYSDSDSCAGTIRCLKLEEMLANKLKCLLQRRHVPDVFDLVFAIFVNRDLEVNRREVLSTFFKKTIYEPSPGVARQLLLELPLAALRAAWTRYIVAPVQTALDFDSALKQFETIINDLFAAYPVGGRHSLAFFPSNLRTPLMQAGSEQKLIKIQYDGVSRIAEPYALTFKRRKSDGHGEEYLYVYDRTGGKSGPGLKAMFNHKIGSLELTDETFEPRYQIELGKAGEFLGKGYFSGSHGPRKPNSIGRVRKAKQGLQYVVECPYCNRRFKRMQADTTLKAHKNQFGGECYGRSGYVVDQEFIY